MLYIVHVIHQYVFMQYMYFPDTFVLWIMQGEIQELNAGVLDPVYSSKCTGLFHV